MSPLRAAHAVLFDLDNTLYPYAPCHEAGLARAQRRLAAFLTLSPRAFRAHYLAARRVVARQHWSTAASHHRLLYFRRMCERALHAPAIRHALALSDAYWNGYVAAMTLDPAAKPLLQALRRRGIVLGLLTDLLEETQLRKLVALGLADRFDAVVTSEEVGCEKPDSAMFHAVLRKLRVAPRDAVMVGDDYRNDIQGAKRAGLRTVWVTASPPARRPAAADLVVPALRALQEAA